MTVGLPGLNSVAGRNRLHLTSYLLSHFSPLLEIGYDAPKDYPFCLWLLSSPSLAPVLCCSGPFAVMIACFIPSCVCFDARSRFLSFLFAHTYPRVDVYTPMRCAILLAQTTSFYLVGPGVTGLGRALWTLFSSDHDGMTLLGHTGVPVSCQYLCCNRVDISSSHRDIGLGM